MSGLRLGVLVSGGGTNLQSIIDATENGMLQSKVVCVISNKKDAYGLERARKHNIPDYFVDPKEAGYNQSILDILLEAKVDLVVCAGYIKILDQTLLDVYGGRIINIHPSLLPKYGGMGYYGIHVHEAVIAAGEKESGATVHYIDAGVDTGKIILQRKLEVLPDDTPQSLQARILDQIEHHIFVEAIQMLEGSQPPMKILVI